MASGCATGKSTGCRRHDRHVADLIAGNVFRQFQQHGPRPLFLRDAKRIAHDGRDAARAHDLPGHLGQRLHRRDHVDDLELGLLAGHDRLLPRQQNHRHRAEVRVGGAGREIERARSQRGDADARAPGEPAMGGRHEGRRLLVPRQDQLNLRLPQRLDDVEILFAGHAEDAIDAFVRERCYQQVRTFAHGVLVECRINPIQSASRLDTGYA